MDDLTAPWPDRMDTEVEKFVRHWWGQFLPNCRRLDKGNQGARLYDIESISLTHLLDHDLEAEDQLHHEQDAWDKDEIARCEEEEKDVLFGNLSDNLRPLGTGTGNSGKLLRR